MEDKIKNFEDTLKLMMNCKCYAMMSSVSNSKCAQNNGCDGSCKLFKQIISQYTNDIKNI